MVACRACAVAQPSPAVFFFLSSSLLPWKKKWIVFEIVFEIRPTLRRFVLYVLAGRAGNICADISVPPARESLRSRVRLCGCTWALLLLFLLRDAFHTNRPRVLSCLCVRSLTEPPLHATVLPCLFECFSSIYENITYGLEEGEFTEEDVYTASKQACAHDFITGFAGGTCV